MLTALLIVGGLAVVLGLLLGYAALRFKTQGNPIADQIDQLLPQTQCGQCTYPGCRPYAEAIAAGDADINQCPPGGEDTIRALAELLEVEAKPLNEAHGENTQRPLKAIIEEPDCIGCTLCIQACPVDAIVGTSKRMHTVIAEECTGCKLCLPPCPVDCIKMIEEAPATSNWQWPEPVNPAALHEPVIKITPIKEVLPS